MFDQLLGVLLEFRRTSSPYLEPSAGPAVTVATRPSEPPATPVPSAPTRSPAAAPATRARPSLVYVRVLKDSRPVEVGSETIQLKADDILSLPPETARLLVDAKAVEPVESSSVRPVT